MVNFSQRLGKLSPYPFVEISRIIAEKRAAGATLLRSASATQTYRRPSTSLTGC